VLAVVALVDTVVMEVLAALVVEEME